MNPIAGFLNVDKPQGWTSSDVVVKLRSNLRLRKRRIKIGHGGTLDPLATGVLPVCVGYATRLSEYLLSADKTYLMTARLGVSTDTYDSEGDITQEFGFNEVSKSFLISTLTEFEGEIDQIPPMFSAIKRQGTPLYKLARRGKTVHREPRRINVKSLVLTRWDPPNSEIRIECSSGFYARSLAHDIGQRLDCGAHMTSLRRERAGEFRIEDSVSIDDLISEASDDVWVRHLHKPDMVLKKFQALVLDDEQVPDFLNGWPIPTVSELGSDSGDLFRIYSGNQEFLGLARHDPVTETLKPFKVFAQQITVSN